MRQAFSDVRDFHLAFGHPVGQKPAYLSADRVAARTAWLREEVDEFREAQEIADQADALIDLIYFALGGLVEMGLEPQELFKIVHQANMAKLFPDGRPRYREDSKVIKPSGWREPKSRMQLEILRQENDSLSSGPRYPLVEAEPGYCLAAVLRV